MSDTRIRRLIHPAGTVAGVILALAALVTAVRGNEAPEPTHRIVVLEAKVSIFEKWLERIEAKLDRAIERKEKNP